jgi:hypothetical protein
VSPAPIQVAVGDDGTFTIPSMPEGNYRFWFLVPGTSVQGAYVEDIREGGVSVFDTGIHIGTEPPLPIQIVMKTDAGAIDGNVLDSNRQPKQGAVVVVVPAAQRRQNLMLYKTATSNVLGRFVIRGVQPGLYKVFAWDEVPSGAYQNPEFLARYEDRGQPVSVSPSTTANTTVTIIPVGN